MPAHDWTRVDAGTFHDLQLAWVAEVSRMLNQGALPASHYAMIEPQPGDAFARLKYGGDPRPSATGEVSDVNVDADWPRLSIVRVSDDAVIYAMLRRSVVVRRADGDRIVARIEIAGPGDKCSARSVRAFAELMAEHADAGHHLLIVDLFPPRRHDPGGLCNAAFEAMGGEPFPLPADRQLCVAAYRVETPGRVELYAEPLGVGAPPPLPDVPLFFTPDRYVNVPMEATYDAAWQATPRRWRDVIAPPA